MLWPVWVALAVVAIATAWRRDPRPAIAILGGLFVMQVVMMTAPVPVHYLGASAVWVGIGGLIARKYNHPLCGALLVASGLCYLVGRLTGLPVALGSWPFIVSDALGLLALVVAGGWHHGLVSLAGRNRLLGRYSGGWLDGLGAGMVGRAWKGW